MRLKRLTLSAFRSWEALTFNFTPGLTILTGPNGSGKTSIRMGVQYAINGSCPGNLKRPQLIKTDSVAPFKVGLEMDNEGKAVSLIRDSSRVFCSVDGVQYSIRESSFLEQLRVAMQYAFLSPDQAAFVDMPSYKRKEMMEELIPAVSLLRGFTRDRLKELSRKVAEKKYVIYTNVHSANAAISQQRIALGHAEGHLQAEEQRLNMLRDLVVASLPCTEEQYKGYHDENAKARARIEELNGYIGDSRAWMERALALNRQHESVAYSRKRLEQDIARSRAKVDGLSATIGDGTPVVCPHCTHELVCKECGTAIIDTAVQNPKIERDLKAEQVLLSQLQFQLDAMVQQFGNVTLVPREDIAACEQNVNAAYTEMRELERAVHDNQLKISAYEQAVRNLRETEKLGLVEQSADALRTQVAEMRFSLTVAEKALERKTKTCTVMENLLSTFMAADSMVNDKLPSIYFDRFLEKLSTYCNYLLAPISNMRMALSADGDGVHAEVDGKQFAQLSSGEKQRIRIATTLAFSLLSKQSDTLFLDEVFDHALDDEGVDALALLLSTTMRSFFDNIILVSHSPSLVTRLAPDRVVHLSKEGSTSVFKDSMA